MNPLLHICSRVYSFICRKSLLETLIEVESDLRKSDQALNIAVAIAVELSSENKTLQLKPEALEAVKIKFSELVAKVETAAKLRQDLEKGGMWKNWNGRN